MPTPLVPQVPDSKDDRRLSRFTQVVSNILNALSRAGNLAQTGPAEFRLLTGGFSAARAPTIADDDTAGVIVPTIWVNTLTSRFYICVDNSTGAAVWRGPY